MTDWRRRQSVIVLGHERNRQDGVGGRTRASSIWNKSKRIFSAASVPRRARSACSAVRCWARRWSRRAAPSSRRLCHSLHAYFLRPGDPKIPILYEVDRARDGKSFTSRRVVAIQHGEQIFNLAASFQTESRVSNISSTCPRCRRRRVWKMSRCPDAPRGAIPGAAQGMDRAAASVRNAAGHSRRSRPTARRARRSTMSGSAPPGPCQATSPAPDAARLSPPTCRCSKPRCCRTARAISRRCRWPASITRCGFTATSALDDWLLYAQDSPSASGRARLQPRLIFTRDGVLVASVAQEGLIRPRE